MRADLVLIHRTGPDQSEPGKRLRMAIRFTSCSIPDCKGNAHWEAKGARGWCVAHWCRWKRSGDPLKGRTSPGKPIIYLENNVLAFAKDECLFWPYALNNYGHAIIARAGASTRVARVVCERIHGPALSSEHEAAHSCGNGHLGCVAPKHLRWATHVENEADKILHGTANRGESHVWAKLSEADVRKVRALDGIATHEIIAAQFGISRGAVRMIIRRETWAWLE